MNLNGEDPIWGWAHQLGLAVSPLFGVTAGAPEGKHYALLDGRSGSFACSTGEVLRLTPEQSRDWQWSADLSHHVIVTDAEVRVRSGREVSSRRFARASIERNLLEFFKFLEAPRPGALPDIVPFLVDEFLQMWGVLPGDQPGGHSALSAFLIALLAAGERDPAIFEDREWRRQTGMELGFTDDELVRIDALGDTLVNRAITLSRRAPSGLCIVPDLVFRHTAGRLFQEAHAYLESAQYTLFGGGNITTIPTFSPSGAYFTPLVLARSVAECALQHWDRLPEELTIADYACGSAIFLTEALRVLERRGFAGKVRLIGRDISPEAVTMARVAIATASRGLRDIHVVANVERLDAVTADDWPPADVVLMNPPFRSWEQMSLDHREWVRAVLGASIRGRPDLSVGFVERALAALSPVGVLATLLPAGVLSSDGLAAWRSSLLERATPSLVAVLGEHGLFRQATVNVAVLVLQKSPDRPADARKLELAWASTEPGAASQALRAIRRFNVAPAEASAETVQKGHRIWNVTQTKVATLRDRPSWLPGPGALGPLLDMLRDSVPSRVENLFHVHQGIRTGANPIFILEEARFKRLPKTEQQFFRPVVDAESFNAGELEPVRFLFIADPLWTSEEAVQSAVPTFFRETLQPAAPSLAERKGLSRPERWWELTRVRKWSFAGVPRLVSKRFGLYPAFARDYKGNLAVVQANAWVPTSFLTQKHDERGNDEVRELLTAYWWLLNSRVTVALLREFCPNVAGGQLDLEHKYVRHVPLPDLRERTRTDPALQHLAMDIRERNRDLLPSVEDRDSFAALAYGTSLSDWPLREMRD